MSRWDLDNVISQTQVLAETVTDIIHGAVSVSVGVGSHPVH